jgi:hypothetical protein
MLMLLDTWQVMDVYVVPELYCLSRNFISTCCFKKISLAMLSDRDPDRALQAYQSAYTCSLLLYSNLSQFVPCRFDLIFKFLTSISAILPVGLPYILLCMPNIPDNLRYCWNLQFGWYL